MTFVRHPMFVIWHSSDEPHQVTQSGALLPQNSKVPDNLRISVEMSVINLITSVERWDEIQNYKLSASLYLWQYDKCLCCCFEKQSDKKKYAIQHWQYPALKTHTIPPAIVLDLQSGFLLFFGYSAHMCIYLKIYEKKDIWCIFTHTLKFGGKCKYYIMYTRRKMADFYVLKAKKVLKVKSNSFDDGFVSCCQCYCSIRSQCTVWKYFFLAAGKI